MRVELTVNSARVVAEVAPLTRLLDFLREDRRLTGAKEGCGEGECGACSVLVDGVLTLSCLVPMAQVEATSVLTIEGLGPGEAGRLAPVQEALLDAGGTQCGICTPGIVMAAHALLAVNPRPTLEEVRDAFAGNLCRCTGYTAIYRAVLSAAGAPADF